MKKDETPSQIWARGFQDGMICALVQVLRYEGLRTPLAEMLAQGIGPVRHEIDAGDKEMILKHKVDLKFEV